MKILSAIICAISCVLLPQQSTAKTLFTWTDEAGVIHISQQMPPGNIKANDRWVYVPKTRANKTEADLSTAKQASKSPVLVATKQAKTERKIAEAARRTALEAIEEANKRKNETDAFLEPWRSKTRIRRNMQLKIENRIKETNQLIAKAEKLIKIANKAEENARRAEAEAKKLQDQFFDEYRSIVNE